MPDNTLEKIGEPYEIAGFVFQVVRMWKEVVVKGRGEECVIPAEGYAIHCKPARDGGYFHAMYHDFSDAETVMRRFTERMDMQVYSVNFTSGMNPAVLTSLEHEQGEQ
jgi:hypothetical protein